MVVFLNLSWIYFNILKQIRISKRNRDTKGCEHPNRQTQKHHMAIEDCYGNSINDLKSEYELIVN